MGEQRGVRRIPLKEAAVALGVSKDAVRQRIRRDTLRSDKGEDGRVYVYLDASVDDVQADAPGGAADPALVDELRDRVRYLERQVEEEREARRRADTLLARLMDRMPELEAASETPGSPATASGEPERAAPRSTAAEAQEVSERPQLRNGWREPVDKRPWWPYVLGLVAMVVGVAAGNLEYYRWDTQFVWTSTWLGVPSSLGIWVGFRQRYVRVWRREVPLGAILGAVFVSIILLFDPNFAFRLFSRSTIEGTLFCAYIIAPWLLLYVSGVLIGNARQRRLTGRRTGIIPGSPLSRTTEGSTGSGTGWTPRKQAILGFVGTVLAALLGLMGTIVGAIMASGG